MADPLVSADSAVSALVACRDFISSIAPPIVSTTTITQRVIPDILVILNPFLSRSGHRLRRRGDRKHYGLIFQK
jgi:hypothetical protein